MTAQEVIDLAREGYPGFTDRHAPDPIIWRFLTGYQRTMLTKAARIRPDDFSLWETHNLPLPTFDNGVSTAEALLRIGGDATMSSSQQRVKLHIVPWEERYSTRVWPACSVVYDNIYLLGVAGDWTPYSQFRIRLVPKPQNIAAASDTFVLPDESLEMLAAAVQRFLTQRGPAEKHVMAHFINQASVKEGEFLDMLGGRSIGQVSLVPDVW